MMKHRGFYDTVLNEWKSLKRARTQRTKELSEAKESNRYSFDYLQYEEKKLKDYCKEQRSVLEQTIRDTRAKYEADLKTNYSPITGAVSEGLKNAISLGLELTPADLKIMMEQAKTSLDARIIHERASRLGYDISGYRSYEERLVDFDNFCQILTREAPPEFEGYENWDKLILQDAYEIYKDLDTVAPVVVETRLNSFEDADHGIVLADKPKEEVPTSEEAEGFRDGAQMTKDAPTVSRDDVVRDLVEQEALKAVKSARKSREDESPEQAAYRETAKVLSEIVKNQREAPAE